MELKGIAILFMFLLHLFNTHEFSHIYDEYIHIGASSLTFYISLYADVCVAMFLFVSGYGLYFKYSKHNPSRGSYLKSLIPGIKGLMVNYWIILLLFPVFIGVVLGYGESTPGSYEKFLLNFFAIDTSYNGAWWFLTTYLLLAISSGSLFKAILRFHFIAVFSVVGLVYLIGYVQRIKVVLVVDNPILNWFLTEAALYGNSLLPFVVGAWFVKYDVISSIRRFLGPKFTGFPLKVCIIALFLLLFIAKSYLPSLFFAVFFFAATIILYLLWDTTGLVAAALGYLGKHSTNLWLTHMFIYLQFEQFKALIYWSRDPLLILCSLVVVCLAFSYPINWAKDRVMKFFEG